MRGGCECESWNGGFRDMTAEHRVPNKRPRRRPPGVRVRDPASRPRYSRVSPLQQTRPAFSLLAVAQTERRTATRDARRHRYAQEAATQTHPNLPPLCTEAAAAWKTAGFQLRKRASEFKTLLCASLCACSALRTNPARVRLHNCLFKRL